MSLVCALHTVNRQLLLLGGLTTGNLSTQPETLQQPQLLDPIALATLVCLMLRSELLECNVGDLTAMRAMLHSAKPARAQLGVHLWPPALSPGGYLCPA